MMMSVWHFAAGHGSQADRVGVLNHDHFPGGQAGRDLCPIAVTDPRPDDPLFERLPRQLHVDGGLAAQVFFNPSNFNYHQISEALGLEKAPQLDVIRNGELKAAYRPLKDKGFDLVSKSVSSLTLAQARGDLYRMKYISENNDIEMQFTYIDQDFGYAKVTKDMFDSHYLLTIYEYGPVTQWSLIKR